MIDYKAVFADNLSHLRSHKGWTQLELAEKLNYSDKTVSKWERGESMPDVIMLKQISDLFGITIDELLTDHKGKPVKTWKQDSIAPEKKEKEKKEHKTFLEKVNAMDDKGRAHAYKVRQLISVVSVIGVWVLTTAALIIAWAVTGKVFGMIAAYTLPVMFILCIVFNSIWGKHKLAWNWVYISLLILSMILDVYLQLRHFGHNVWMLFLIMIPVEILLFFVFRLSGIDRWFGKKKGKKKAEKPEELSQTESEKTA